MTPERTAGVVGQLRQLATAIAPDDQTDGQLLVRFLTDRDEAAFALIVRRHGAMVLSVCRRVTGNLVDADDAFQAVFVVLVRRARDLITQPTVGNWLYGVARRAALKARAVAARRRLKEARAARPEVVRDQTGANEVAEVIDAELCRLPDRYREPVVLCELEGRPRQEVAALLGVPEGTISSRLAYARKLLADRLRRHGFTLCVLVPGILSGNATARVPESLVLATVQAASAGATPAVTKLVTEVTKAMFIDKLRIGVAVFAAVILGAGVGLSALSRVTAAPQAKPVQRAAEKDVKAKDLTDKEAATRKSLEGTWELQKQVIDDKELEFQFDYYRYTFAERTVKIEYKRTGADEDKHERELSFTVNPTTKPREMQFYAKDNLVLGIYELNGDTLKFAHHGISELERPRGFTVADNRIEDMPLIVWEFKRKK
jgi:RNA polymerase sigma factor (sigma-70 family)